MHEPREYCGCVAREVQRIGEEDAVELFVAECGEDVLAREVGDDGDDRGLPQAFERANGAAVAIDGVDAAPGAEQFSERVGEGAFARADIGPCARARRDRCSE